MGHFIYWIHQPGEKDIYTQGYVGRTDDIEERKKAHSKEKSKVGIAIRKGVKSGNKYRFDIMESDLTEGQAKKREKYYRPHKNIGLNEKAGG